ncbi:MAG: Tn3 family transposase [Oligoflexia bacterium]|nr:Tn3 family transposase [Oligoflexia bacterium]
MALEALSKTKRLSILTTTEMEDLYSRPQLNDDERAWLFELNREEQKIFEARTSNATKIDAIIRLGYFKQKQQFFQFDLREVQGDVKHLLGRYFEPPLLDKKAIGNNAKINNQQWVLQVTGYKLFKQSKHFSLLLNKAKNLCRLSASPVFILRELLAEVTLLKITRPAYSTFQNIISLAIVSEQKRIAQIFKDTISSQERSQIFKLLEQEENFYAVTLLKHQPKNFKPTAIRQEIQYYTQYFNLQQIANRLLPLLGISKKSIEYYASLVEHHAVWNLIRTNPDQACLWLLCFISHRCQHMLDNLATMFIYTANQYRDDVKKQAEALLLIHSLSPDEQNQALAKLLRVYTDKNVNDRQTFKKIKKFVYATILPPEHIDRVADELDHRERQRMHQTQFVWQAVDEFANTYRPLLRALVKVLDFEGPQHRATQKAYQFLRNTLNQQEQILSKLPFDKFPMQFISDKILNFIYDHKKKILHTKRYEYECYQIIAEHLNDRSLFLKGSINYQPLEAELLSDWQKNKTSILKKTNRRLLNQSLQQFIEEKARPLDKKIRLVNEAIANKDNPYVKTKQAKDGTTIWTLPYTKKSLELNNPFYEKLPPISIIRVLQFVNEQIQFMRQFTHIKPRYAKSQLDEMSTYACLIANGTNLGIHKMSSLCDLDLGCLQTTEKNFFRLTNLRAANDIVSNAIAKLPIFRYWNLQPGVLHASLDGQKHLTEWENFLARHSPKYFDLFKGVVSYSLIANHIPINAMIIGANEHESRFLFDLIYNNSSDIQPDVFSTDTEGSNKLNFLLLHMIERLYAPRYRSLGDKSSSIISFSDPSKFKDCLIRPQKKLNEKLILSEEDNIKHILASLLMGETKQSTIVTKLSSQKFTSSTKRALWEMNAVLMSDHLLNYISDVIFRQSIQGALCRGEAYHQLRRHIEKVNGRHFRGTNEGQISVWNDCARLLANCVLFYNATMLNRWMEQSDRQGETKKSTFIKHMSPVAWTHINFQGKYEFLSPHETIDIDALLNEILISDDAFKKKD